MAASDCGFGIAAETAVGVTAAMASPIAASVVILLVVGVSPVHGVNGYGPSHE